MKAWMIGAIAALLVVAAMGCGQTKDKDAFDTISGAEAKALMDSESAYTIVDVRTIAEYEEGHIPGAVLLPLDEVAERAEELLPDKEELLLVYCRSGRRSKQAAQQLVRLGYTNVKEFGGILDWQYEVE